MNTTERMVVAGYGQERLKNAASPYASENRRVQIVNLGREEEPAQSQNSSESSVATLGNSARVSADKVQPDVLSIFDGVWVSISPPGPHIVFNRISLNSREVSLPNIGQASVGLSDGRGGSNFRMSGSGFDCFYSILGTSNNQKLVWELKVGDKVCPESAVYEKLSDAIENQSRSRSMRQP